MSKTRKLVARWRKQPNEKSLARVCQDRRGADLRLGEECLISVRPRGRSGADGWYWYGLGQNTCGKPVATMEEAKKQAQEFYAEWKQS
jgi:hypothetical protein